MKEQDLISIIVPIYNVGDCLNKCIESIVGQTYTNLEILLINDGSNDHSESICLTWRRRDNRIIYVSKKNESLGPTRNLGIQMARGNYIAFVDSDDWIDRTFIEKLYANVVEGDKDFARCDYYIVRGTESFLLNNNEYYPFNESNRRKMIASTQAITIWTGLYKKTLWIEHQIEMPPGPHQDLAILGLLFVYAKIIGRCKEALYYYRENRQGNISLTTLGSSSMLPPLKHLMKEYQKRNLFSEYKEELQSIAVNKLNTGMAWFLEGKNQITKKQYYEEIKEFFSQTFGISDSYYENKMIAVGSYNLQRILSRVYFSSDIEDLKFQHSGIISIMSEPVESPVDENRTFRDRMIWADCRKKLVSDIRNANVKYILLDFIEERNDIWDLGDGRYVTDSEALREKKISWQKARIIKRDSDECQKLWEKNCTKFIELLKDHFAPEKVFLVKFFLAEGYGGYGAEHSYENLTQIRRLNDILSDCYTYFESHYEGIHVIESDSRYHYTESGTKYGCLPWHLNINAQFDIQSKINQMLKMQE